MRGRLFAAAVVAWWVITGTVSANGIDHDIILVIAEKEYHKLSIPKILDRETEPIYLDSRQAIAIHELRDVNTKEVKSDLLGKNFVLEFQFTEEGTRLLYSLTERNVGNRLALVIDGDLVIAPEIFEPIPNGIFYYYGKSSKDQLQSLERRIRKKLEDSAK